MRSILLKNLYSVFHFILYSLSVWLLATPQLKVFYAVIQLVTIPVMHLLALVQSPTKMLFHNVAMFKNINLLTICLLNPQLSIAIFFNAPLAPVGTKILNWVAVQSPPSVVHTAPSTSNFCPSAIFNYARLAHCPTVLMP